MNINYSMNGIGFRDKYQLGNNNKIIEMTPSSWFSITKSKHRVKPLRYPDVKKHIENNLPIFYPTLVYYKDKLVDWDGTHRTTAILELNGDIPMPVIIIQLMC